MHCSHCGKASSDWGAVLQARLTPDGFVGFFLLQAVYLLALYMILHATEIRAGRIAGLAREPQSFPVLRMVSQVMRLLGEIGAVVVLAWGLVMVAVTVFAGTASLTGTLLGYFLGAGGLMALPGLLFKAFLVGFLGLLSWYGLAEMVELAVGVGEDVQAM
ncbi:MAG: hypothetical protein AB1758_12605, partial [Candidatus Eremiobacterota bacterium]